MTLWFNLTSRAGTTDSALTNHGTLQIEYLARHFASKSIQFKSIFASDLSRARLTAEGICRHQPSGAEGTPTVPTTTQDLREKDYGSLEGTCWRGSSSARHNENKRRHDGSSPRHVEGETSASMKRRAILFLDSHLIPFIFEPACAKDTIAIVSHGVFLRILWACLVELFDSINISLTPGICPQHEGPPYRLIPSWSNTGYMVVSIHSHPLPPPLPPRAGSTPQVQSTNNEEQSILDTTNERQRSNVLTPLLQGWSMKILAVNNKEHLLGLRRGRGGIGSASHDIRQKKIDHFFKK